MFAVVLSLIKKRTWATEMDDLDREAQGERRGGH
jgi:hypothetical protein